MVRADVQALNFQDPECPCALWRASGNGAGGDSQEISVDYFLREDRSRSKVSTGAFASLSLSAGWADNRRRSHRRSLDLTPPVSARGNGQVVTLLHHRSCRCVAPGHTSFPCLCLYCFPMKSPGLLDPGPTLLHHNLVSVNPCTPCF